jgi:poly-beta-hydroxyalkanoate depolymerase
VEDEMSKLDDLAKSFDFWMRNYDHHEDSHSQSFRNFITDDHEIEHSGTTYDEYVALAFKLNKMEYSIDWIVPYKKFKALIAQAELSRSIN